VDGREIALRRLHNQHLAGAPLADPVAVVRHFGAMQAQEYAVARWSVGQRTAGFNDDAVRRAVDDGAIIRTHALRPTWHFVAAADIAWIQALTGPRVHAFNAYYYRTHGMTPALVSQSNEVIVAALAGGVTLTRAELADALAEAGIPATGNKLAYHVILAELEGLIVNGPMRGKQHTYALLDARVPAAVRFTPDDALAELTRRYFNSHGPATVKDFAWWSSLTVTQIRRGLATLELPHAEVDGKRFYYIPSDVPGSPALPDVQVLQIYDEYVVAYTESRSIANLAGLPLVGDNPNAIIHAIVRDSQIIGIW